jgi:hypothetical protein
MFLFLLLEYELGHVPNLKDFNSVLDLFTFCNMIIMMNVLDLRTYIESEEAGKGLLEEHDVNSIPSLERYEMAHARGRCWDILLWFFSAYEIFDKDSGEPIDGFKEVAMRYLAHQGSAIIQFKSRALKSKLDDGAWFTLKSLSRQMTLCFCSYTHIPPLSLSVVFREPSSLAFPDSQRYGVRKLVEALPYECKCVHHELDFLSQCLSF